jgi:DNA repair photolyase
LEDIVPLVQEVAVKSVLTRSRLFPYCVNPYAGCSHGCVYCYARFATRFSHPREPWGSFVDVRANAARILERELGHSRPGTVYMSSVCDAWQPLEARYGITRRCLELLLGAGFPLFLQTKSALIERDLDLLQGRPSVTLGITVTTQDDRLARLFEPGAAPPSQRLRVLRAAREQGVRTFIFLGPLLPGISDRGEGLRQLLRAAAEARADFLLVDRLNRRAGMWPAVSAAVSALDAALVPEYKKVLFSPESDTYNAALRERVAAVASEYGLLQRIEWCF